MKIAILGDGWLGNKLREYLGGTLHKVWVTDYEHLDYTLSYDKPEVVINAIGHTGKNVDECEFDRDKTLTANSFAPLIIAEWCIRNNAKLVHLSSGCIFNEEYEEWPNYFNLFYSRSKIYADMPLTRIAKKYGFLVLRLRVPLDDSPHQKNILTKLIQYKKAINIPNSVTYIPDFLKVTQQLVLRDISGTFNVVCDGAITYPSILEEYRLYRKDFDYEIVTLRGLGLERTNIILPVESLKKVGIFPIDIGRAIGDCVSYYVDEEEKLCQSTQK